VRNKEQFVFFGGGNMAQALIAGLLGYGISSSKINVIDPSHSIKKKLKNLFKVTVTKDLDPRILSNKIIILAVKPNKISEVCGKIQASELNNTIIISVAAGATLEGLSQSLPKAKVIVRAMPNTPCLVNKGATVLISNQKRLHNNIKERVKNVFLSVGEVFWVTNEGQIDIATAISGSGPAYFYYFSESLILAAIKLGMPKKLANELVDQTFVGAALLNKDSKDSLSKLRKKVTSKGGTTEAAINSLSEGRLEEIVKRAVECAHKKSLELSER
tara:strand:- start:1917 stop:2735 length:819 start_codon:yes stop_codon:yes gene_type:complete